MLDYKTLKREIEAGGDYASALAAEDYPALADLLNAKSMTHKQSLGNISRDAFITSLLAPLAYVLALAPDDPIRTPFNGWIAVLQLASTVDTNLPAIASTLQGLQAALQGAGQGDLFTDDLLQAVLYRPGSRAEELLGQGMIVSAEDVRNAHIGDWN